MLRWRLAIATAGKSGSMEKGARSAAADWRRSGDPACLRARHPVRRPPGRRMSRATGERDVEARVEAIRRELPAHVVTLCNLGQRLEDRADELRSRLQANKVIALDRRWRGKGHEDRDILVDFLK